MPQRGWRSWSRWLPAVLVGVVCAGGGFWAGRVAVTPQAPAGAASSQVVLAQVREARVGRALPYGVTVRQASKPVARNALSGVVTATHAGRLKVGEAAYVVAGVPVRVVRGSVPFYRPLAAEDRGPDVKQLEDALVAMGFLDEADSWFGWSTTVAVQRWQKQLGIPQTGRVELGELVAVPSLPAAVALGEAIVTGGVLAGGEESVLAAVGERTFAVELSEEQARLVPNDARVVVRFKDHSWPARITESVVDPDSRLTRLLLAGADGGPVCAAECGQLPADATVQLSGQVFVVPEVSGPAVPAAAVATNADGSAFVLDEAGVKVPVTVKGAGNGLVVIDGIAVGRTVRVGRTAGSGPPGVAPSPGPTRPSPGSSSSRPSPSSPGPGASGVGSGS